MKNTATLEKNIASDIIDNECSVDQDVTKKLTNIMDKHIVTIQKQKRTVTKLMQENESAKHRHHVSFIVIKIPHNISNRGKGPQDFLTITFS